jgi:hypothetical protein
MAAFRSRPRRSGSRRLAPRSKAPRGPRRAPSGPVAPEFARRYADVPGALRFSVAFWDAVLLDPALFGLVLAQRGVRALVRKILRDARRRETAAAASLRGAPRKEDIDSAWSIAPRTVQDALRIGSRLLDLEPTVDNSRVWKENPLTGKREVVFRHAGVKGWLQEHCPGVQYNTAMRYKKLASRLRTVCGVAGNIPFEWLLPGAELPAGKLDAATLAAVEKGRAALEKILAETKSLRGLDRVVEREMNLAGLPRKNKGISAIPHDPAPAAGGKARSRRARRTAVGRLAAEARRTRILSAVREAGMRAEGRRLRHCFGRFLARFGEGLPTFGKNA